MKNKLIKETILIGISIIPIAYMLYFWDSLPQEIATHFDLEGNANDYTKKGNLLWMLGGLMFFIYLLMTFLPKIDPKKQIEQMGSKYFKVKLLIISFMSATFTSIIYSSLHKDAKSNITLLIFAIFFIIMGNYMQTIKPNYFLGMRTPWTLQSEIVWKKTHKLAGILMIIGGIAIAVSFFALSESLSTKLMLPILLITVIIPYLNSYVIYKKEQKQMT